MFIPIKCLSVFYFSDFEWSPRDRSKVSSCACGFSCQHGACDSPVWTCLGRCCLHWVQEVVLDLPVFPELVGNGGRECRQITCAQKVHQMAHLVFGFLPLNPRRYSKYSDEDYICKTKKVAQMRHPLHMSLHTAMRYSVAACLRWHNGDLSWRAKKAFFEVALDKGGWHVHLCTVSMFFLSETSSGL